MLIVLAKVSLPPPPPLLIKQSETRLTAVQLSFFFPRYLSTRSLTTTAVFVISWSQHETRDYEMHLSIEPPPREVWGIDGGY